MCEPMVVKVGDYIVIQRQSYMKLLKVKENGSVMLGKDQLKLDVVLGRPFFSTYKMEPRKPSKRDFVLTPCDSAVTLAERLSDSVSGGIDNRNIFDDGSSQSLSTEDIVGMRDSGMAGHEIVGQLIENSKTFKNKTEYSQVKYLKKKEKKYFEYVTIRRPTLRLISEILYRQDPSKVLGIRMDTLAQMTTATGMTTQGTYILYESGCLGLVAASLLNCLDEGGHLVHCFPGNLPQKQAINSMNFTEAQLSRLISVNIYSLLRQLLQGDVKPSKSNGTEENDLTNIGNCSQGDAKTWESNHTVNSSAEANHHCLVDSNDPVCKSGVLICNTVDRTDSVCKDEASNCDSVDKNSVCRGEVNCNLVDEKGTVCNEEFLGCSSVEKKDLGFKEKVLGDMEEEMVTGELTKKQRQEGSYKLEKVLGDTKETDEEFSKKRRHAEEEEGGAKKARWELETQRAADLLRVRPADGLVIVAREDPANILMTLLKFVGISRPFVVYSLVREPLLELYVQLKCRSDVTALRLTESWLRSHQILPDRTHPDILTSGGGGYLLSGTVVDSSFLSLDDR